MNSKSFQRRCYKVSNRSTKIVIKILFQSVNIFLISAFTVDFLGAYSALAWKHAGTFKGSSAAMFSVYASMCICESSTHNIREKNSILIQGYRGEISFQYLPKLVFCSRGRLKVVFLNVQCICNWLYLCSSTVLDTWVLLYDVVDLWHIGKKKYFAYSQIKDRKKCPDSYIYYYLQ